VKTETTTQEFRAQLLNGWLVSCILHGFLLVSFLPLFRQSLMPLPQEPFHWNVVLVQSTPTAHESVQTADAIKRPAPKPPDRTPTASLTNRTTRQAAPTTERISSREPKTEAPTAPTFMPDSPSSVISPRESVTSSIPHELPPPLIQANEFSRQPTDTPIGTTTQAPPQLETAVAAAPLEKNARSTDATQPSPLPATDLDIPAASAIRPDYGWLQQAIFRRLEELKRSSHPSLDDSRLLKVLVKAVVSKEGILLDSAVVKSSGLDRIDQEAVALVQRAFPMQLDRPLDRQQVAMRIPITYSRE
jgi:outer membrane biosynthesis protein TonB